MRAAMLLGVGGPEMLEVRDNVPVPDVAPGELLVRAAACGVNNTDINTRVGWYSRSVTSATTGSLLEEPFGITRTPLLGFLSTLLGWRPRKVRGDDNADSRNGGPSW